MSCDCEVLLKWVLRFYVLPLAVVYEVLYRGVFGLTAELEEAVDFIRQQKKPAADINGKM